MSVSSVSSASNPYALQTNASYKSKRTDFSALTGAINSGDLTGAQASLAAFLKDIQSSQSSNSLLNSNTQLGKDFQAVQSALQSGDIKSAQTALQTLQQDFSKVQGGKHHHHHHKQADQANLVSNANTPPSTGTTTASASGSSINAIV
ncbi:MAG TPA: hypothetical protein VL126_04890 [Bacteroidota bacterium]|nr:hypothetical protein [Bacteroidota bacterium]